MKSKRQKSKKFYIFILTLVFLCVVGSGVSVVEYQTYNVSYHHEVALAQMGVQHLRMAVTLLKALPKDPFDAQRVSQAQHEFAAGLTNFVQVDNDLKTLPAISASIPVYGVRLRAALDLLPVAIELSQVGVTGCDLLNLIISRFHDPLNTHAQNLTMKDFSIIEKDFNQIKTSFDLIVHQINHLQPGDLQVDPRLGKYFATFQRDMPQLQAWLDVVEKLLPVAPTLLGIGTPTNYLIEVLDSTELRPGGGFIGTYGIATLSGGRLTTAHITDTYLLDKAYNAAGHHIPFPSAYTWFDLASSWGLRDSNLDADFPTAAHYAELNYAREGGRLPIRGVIAITPAVIEQALRITGPITVPEYHETITSQNLVDRIHHYQVGTGDRSNGDNPSPDGLSSVRKHFTALLAVHFLARLHHLPPSSLPKLLQLLASSLHSKDVQIYLNPGIAEGLLHSYHLDAAIQAPGGDSLFVVDANISPNKASRLITTTLDDQVTIDAQGNAVHHTIMRYTWIRKGPVFGSKLYRDYVRIYVPPGSLLQRQDGWQLRGTSEAFGRKVWAGFFTLSYGHSRTIVLEWMVPTVATKDANGWHYQYLLQRQAGTQWQLHLQMTLPSCAVMRGKSGGLLSSNKRVVTLTQSLEEDMSLGLNYAC
jgi:hypothetical protein